MLRILIISNFALILAMNDSNSQQTSNQQPKRLTSTLNAQAVPFKPVSASSLPQFEQNLPNFSPTQHFSHLQDSVEPQYLSHHMHHLLHHPTNFPMRTSPDYLQNMQSSLYSDPQNLAPQLHHISPQIPEPEDQPLLSEEGLPFLPEHLYDSDLEDKHELHESLVIDENFPSNSFLQQENPLLIGSIYDDNLHRPFSQSASVNLQRNVGQSSLTKHGQTSDQFQENITQPINDVRTIPNRTDEEIFMPITRPIGYEIGHQVRSTKEEMVVDGGKSSYSSNIMQNPTNGSELEKEDKTSIKVLDKNEANFAVDQIMTKLSLEDEADKESLEGKTKSSEEKRKQKSESEDGRKSGHSIELHKKGKPFKISYGSVSGAIHSGLAGFQQKKPLEIETEQKNESPPSYAEKLKQTNAMTSVGQKQAEYGHQQHSSSSSPSAKSERNVMSIGMKPVSVPMERDVQAQHQLQIGQQKEQPNHLDRKEFPQSGKPETSKQRRVEKALKLPKKNLPANSSTSVMAVPSSPSSPSSTRSSHTHSTSSIGSIPMLSTDKMALAKTKNAFEILAKEADLNVKGNQKTEDKSDSKEEAIRSGSRQQGSDKAESAKKKKKGKAGSSSGGNVKVKSKKEERKEMLELERIIRENKKEARRLEQNVKKHGHQVSTKTDKETASSSGSEDAKTAADRQALMTPMFAIIDQVKELNIFKRECEELAKGEMKEAKLSELMSKYKHFMKSLENFALHFADQSGTQLRPFTHLKDVLKQFEVISPEMRVENIKDIVQDCLAYMDGNGNITKDKQSLTIFDELFKGSISKYFKNKLESSVKNQLISINFTTDISELKMMINKYEEEIKKVKHIKNDAKMAILNAILGTMEDWYDQHVDRQLLEAVGYLYVDVKGKGEVGGTKCFLDDIGKCLMIGFKSALPYRRQQIWNAVETILKFSDLLLKRNSSNSSLPSLTVQHGEKNPSGSSYSSAQKCPSNITTRDKSDSSDLASFKVSKRPEERGETTMSSTLRNLIDVILMQMDLIETIKDCVAETATLEKPSELHLLGNTYKEVLELLENFTNIYGSEYNWNGETFVGEIFKWIHGIYKAKTEEEKKKSDPKTLVDIMRKSLALLDAHDGEVNFALLMEYVYKLNALLAHERRSLSIEEHEGISRNLIETFYMTELDPPLREAFSFQFIGMRQTILPANERVERMRKSVAKRGFTSLAVTMRKHGAPKQREGQFEKAQEILERFFDKWTEGLETEIRADLPGYLAKILEFEEEETFKGKQKKGKEKENVEKSATEQKFKNSLNLEQMADKYIERDAYTQRYGGITIHGNKLPNGLIAVNELLKGGWEASSSSSSKAGRIAEKAMKPGKDEEEKLLRVSLDWKLVLENIRTMIRYMKLLSLLQNAEGRVNTKVDGLHVHVRVWAILFENNISPILDGFNIYKEENPDVKELLNKQGDDNIMREFLQFIAYGMEKFLTEHGQREKGKQIKEALVTLVILEQTYTMQHRNKHLSRLLAVKDVDDLSKDDDDDHFKTCKEFDYLMLD